MIQILLIVAIALIVFYLILNIQEIPGMWKFFLAVIEMIIVSQIFIKKYKMPSEMGLVLVKSKKSLAVIDKMANHNKLFNFFADVGNSIAYGLLSLVIMKKKATISAIILGLFILGFASFIVGPSAFIFLFDILNVGDMEKSVSTVSGNIEFGFWIVSAMLLIGGLFLFILFGILYYGVVIIADIINTITFGTQFTTEPGGTLLLPGVNLPFFEGILALAIVLIVHEGAHAILTRIAKIPLLSSGIVLFGIIPMGAFIEPDEKKLSKLDDERQTRVLIAGSTSNLITSCVIFTIFFLYVTIGNYIGIFQIAYDGIWNIAGFEFAVAFAPFKFIYITLGLMFALNFIVGAVNLLPLPLFDGYRIIEVNVKQRYIVKALMYVTLAFFILNFVPWFLK
ncbi:hypothetical protein KKF81_05235 [Candidatus Micrarchaeota archaeon]|nr:hypothetical protein [Candidatus Micrarchaeota archaeon]MBU1166330.1 hypothetical protein [Candidatus Micrarchaeota archaeon]MBU1886418.1 hypothetical protein [Candidatus Micrarchaeota archaeon]